MMKYLISCIVAIAIGYVLITYSFADDLAPDPIEITIENNQVVSSNFVGNGVQWDAYPHGDSEQSKWGNMMTDKKWQKLYHRLNFMKPHLIRLMIGAKWRYLKGIDENGQAIIDHQKELEPLKKILDYCQKNNITVLFGEWWPPDFINKIDDGRWMEMASEYLRFLIEDEGYTCIKYYGLVNEPNGYWSAANGNWDQWKSAIEKFHAKLRKKSIANKVQIAGPDAVAHYDNPNSKYTGREWVKQTALQLGDIVGPLEMHAYSGANKVRSGRFTEYYHDLARFADAHHKSLLMGELGFKYSENDLLKKENERRVHEDPNASGDSNMMVYDFFYGIDMADALIQSMNLGFDGVAAWDLDDAMHTNGDTGDKSSLKRWGMWNILGKELISKPEDETIRPWFYPWSLMCRYFPPGSKILKVTGSDKPGLRMTAGKHGRDYTIVLVNNSDSTYQIHLKLDKKTQLSLKKYLYAENDHPKDEDDFPVVKKQLHDMDLHKGIEVFVPAKSFQLFTSMDIK